MEQGKPEQDIQIPVLKKEEKERKGAGVVLPSAAGKTASAGGFAAFMAGKAGIALLACALGGAGLIGYGVLQQGQVRRVDSAPQLAAPDMSMRVGVRDSQGSKSLSYISKAGEGQLRWDDANAVRAKDARAEDAKPDEAKPGGDETDAAKSKEGLGQAPDHFTDTQKLGSLSGAKLSGQLGSRFGNNIFQGGGFTPKQSQLDSKLKGLADFRPKTASGGKLGGLNRGMQSLLAKKLGTQGATANRAMGQLKFSGKRSQEAARMGATEAGSTYAADAFNGQASEQGSAPGGPGVTGDQVAPMGGSAPDVTGGGSAPDIGNGGNVTPYQPQVNSAKSMTDTATMLMVIGGVLMAAGLAIMAASSWTGVGAAIGAIILGIGVALLAVGAILQSQAKQMGDQVGNGYGQKDQQKVIDDKASGSGNGAGFQQKNTTVHQDTEKEKNSDYQLK